MTDTTNATPQDLQQRYRQALATLERYEQAHLLHYYHELEPAQQAALLSDIEAQDWQELHTLAEQYVLSDYSPEVPEKLEPPAYYPALPDESLRPRYQEAKRLGESLLRQGQVAAFTVAGGQGTRLGWDGPKGSFPATPLQGKPLFQVFAEYIRKTQAKYQCRLPWYIMTSPLNHEPTQALFAEYNYFGLEPEDVMFFQQGTLPSFSVDGKVLLADKHQLAQNPDGHGGSFSALHRSGALEDMRQRGVSHISYFQVDNPNVKCLDPLFIGLHVQDDAGMSSKMLPKAEAKERVGVFCEVDGRVQVIEYSDLPDELAEARADDGGLRYKAGSIAIHMISVAFAQSLIAADGRLGLPLHRAVKKVPYLDIASGQHIEPEEPNAVKLERFVFDALPLSASSVILETERLEEFAPIKNAEGSDSPATSQALQSQRAARWLAQHGVALPAEDAPLPVIELSPLLAIDAEDLAEATLPARIAPGQDLLLEP